jgi:hypothetical protein
LATTRKSKASTKKDLEAKIAELESKLSQLSSQLGQKSSGQAQTAPPPQSKPAPQTQASKPAPQTQAAAPVTRETLIERVPTGVWHERKTKTPGYVPENPRAWARRHAEGADAPSQPWALQKAKVTGYTAPSNKYFATRQRLAVLPGGRLKYNPQVTGFTGYGIALGHGTSQAKAQAAPPPPPPPQNRTLPKESGGSSGGGGSSKKESLENYEREYLARLAQQEKEAHDLYQAAAELAAKRRASSGSTSSGGSSRGSLPKGF